MMPVPADEDHKIIRVTDHLENRPARTAPTLPPLVWELRADTERVPLRLEVLVQHRQRNIRQKRRENPTLRGTRIGILVPAVLSQDTSLEESLDQSENAFVLDSPTYP